jgi:hypothetical protein
VAEAPEIAVPLVEVAVASATAAEALALAVASEWPEVSAALALALPPLVALVVARDELLPTEEAVELAVLPRPSAEAFACALPSSDEPAVDVATPRFAPVALAIEVPSVVAAFATAPLVVPERAVA